jgi:Family of unknown function (DUF6496)
MPEKETIERAKQDKQEGKSPSTQAGEFVREEMHHIREGKHGARSTKQAIAIGLSKARRAGVDLGAPEKGKGSPEVRRKAEQDLAQGESEDQQRPSSRRSRATTKALQREGSAATSKKSLSRQASSAARARGAESRHEAAMKAVETKGHKGLSRAAKKAGKSRSRAA